MAISTKFSSLISSISKATNEAVIFNLSAPGAVKLLNPWALSDRDGSISADIISSIIWNPTYDLKYYYTDLILKFHHQHLQNVL